MSYAGSILFIGAGATLATDLWAIVRKRLLGVPAPDWGLVGRWFGHMARGRFRHERIAAAAPVRGERAIGWAAHYLIGIAFAGVLLAICGLAWARQPTLAPALALGIATVAAPFLLMQPGMGAGFAASRTPRPNATRLQSLLTHAVFGVGLYAAALVLKLLSGE
jgi:hypothetical protein